MDATDIFSDDLGEARERFVRAGQAQNRTPRGFGKSAFGHPLAEVVRLGEENAKRVLVLCGGNRKADALCCSAILSGWLSEFGQAQLPPNTAMILVHHGAAPPTGGEGYSVEPQEVRQWDDEVLTKVEERYAAYARAQGLDADGNPLPPAEGDGAIAGFPPKVLDSLAKSLFTDGGERLAILDIRIGLGRFGEADITACHPPGSDAASRVADWFGLTETADDETAPQQRPDSVAAGLSRRADALELTTVALEFGVYSMKSVLDSLTRGSDGKPAADKRRLLHPQGADWKNAVWNNAMINIQRALGGLQR